MPCGRCGVQKMVESGDVVIVEFPGVQSTKRRPAVVVSSSAYHRTRPDVILGLVTSQIDSAKHPSDHLLADWMQASLRKPSAFRAFLITMPIKAVQVVGHLSERDWLSVKQCLGEALETN